MKKLVIVILIPVILFLGHSISRAQEMEPQYVDPDELINQTQEENSIDDTEGDYQSQKYSHKGEILAIEDTPCSSYVNSQDTCQLVTFKIVSGEKKGQEHKTSLDPNRDVLAKEWNLKIGDDVVITEFVVNGESIFEITDLYRANSLSIFLLIYIVIVLIVGRLQGLGSIIGLALSILVIIKVVVPLTLDGWDPITVSLVGGLAVLLPSIYFSHGFNFKTTIALVGTTIGLIVTGVLAHVAIGTVNLTGFGNEASLYLTSGENQLNVGNILLASMIIGGIGLIDDVTVSQVAVIREIYLENKNIDTKKLYKKAMNVGKDHIASMVNTLFLAYTASSLPLILVLVSNEAQIIDIVNIESFAEEIARTLVASTGLVLTLPITTLLAAYIYTSKNPLYKRFK